MLVVWASGTLAPMHARPPRRMRLFLRAFACAGGALFWADSSRAQAEQTGQVVSAWSGDVNSFSSVVYPQAPVVGIVKLKGARVHDWTPGDTRRLVLEGDVSLTIADYHFRADRAAVWIKEVGRTPDNHALVQLFAYLDEVGDASQASGQTALRTRTLPMRAVVELAGEVEVAGDAVVRGAYTPRPKTQGAEFLNASVAAFERSLRKAVGEHEVENVPAAYSFSAAEAGGASRRWNAEVPTTQSTSAKPPEQAPFPQPDRATHIEIQPQATGEPSPQVVIPLPGGDPAESTPTGEGSDTIAATESAEAPSAEPVAKPPAVSAAASQTRRAEPLFAKSGTITIASGDITVISNPPKAAGQAEESAVTCVGGVTVLYRDVRGRALQLSSQRAVVFLSKTGDAPLTAAPIPASSVRGIYLEGAVSASDGTYTIRSPQIFYDLVQDRAVMLDAVFSTYSQERGVPLYVRAKEIRQESARQWTARQAIFTNSAFENPELSIGASMVTIEQRARPLAEPSTLPGSPQSESYFHTTAEHVTLRGVGVPFFYWPAYAGDPSQPLLRDLRLENRSGSGIALRTTWNAAQLLGVDAPEGTSIDLLADAYFERGPGVGTRVRWDLARHKGDLFAYAVPLDTGTDLLKPGTEIDRQNEFRGIISLQDRFVMDRVWTITAEGSYISDETFVDAFFETAGETRREFTNRLTATRREDNTILGFEFKTNFNDFTPNEWLQQTPGYSVSKLPEASYVRIADDLLPRRAPGMFTHFQEYRISALALALDEVTPRSRGFNTEFLSQKAFGLSPDQSIADALRAQGYTEEQVGRADTRQEVTAKFTAGPVQVVPFVAARLTFYDNTFAAFSSNPEGNDATRLWTSAGARASATLTRIYDGVDSTLLDIHRLRHTITPSITLWAAGTNVEAKNIPTYDPFVDALADGQAVRIGVAQTLQTKRGGAGRWIDTDLLKLNTDFVFSSDNSDPRTPIGRFFDSRPEYSALGNFFTADGAYRMTDAASIVGSTIYDFDSHQQDMSSAGLMLTHSPGWSTLFDVRYINPQDSTILGMWGTYDLLDKYAVTVAPSYDAAEGRFQSLFLQFTRRFSALQMSLGVTYNDITSETTFGFVIQPYGARRGAGVEGLGTSGFGSVYSGSGGL